MCWRFRLKSLCHEFENNIILGCHTSKTSWPIDLATVPPHFAESHFAECKLPISPNLICSPNLTYFAESRLTFCDKKVRVIQTFFPQIRLGSNFSTGTQCIRPVAGFRPSGGPTRVPPPIPPFTPFFSLSLILFSFHHPLIICPLSTLSNPYCLLLPPRPSHSFPFPNSPPSRPPLPCLNSFSLLPLPSPL